LDRAHEEDAGFISLLLPPITPTSGAQQTTFDSGMKDCAIVARNDILLDVFSANHNHVRQRILT